AVNQRFDGQRYTSFVTRTTRRSTRYSGARDEGGGLPSPAPGPAASRAGRALSQPHLSTPLLPTPLPTAGPTRRRVPGAPGARAPPEGGGQIFLGWCRRQALPGSGRPDGTARRTAGITQIIDSKRF